MRLTYEASIQALRDRDIIDVAVVPTLPKAMPGPSDAPPFGLSFFRTAVQGNLDGLSIPRTLICRSEVSGATFRGSDLSESFLCWNDFIDVDFGDAVLVGADLRSCVFENVAFCRADLRGADLRRCGFTRCDFDHAVLNGAKLSRSARTHVNVSEDQAKVVQWLDDGPEPAGG
jgi:uncharacterized protein YjbI with pentapeptide repeats